MCLKQKSTQENVLEGSGNSTALNCIRWQYDYIGVDCLNLSARHGCYNDPLCYTGQFRGAEVPLCPWIQQRHLECGVLLWSAELLFCPFMLPDVTSHWGATHQQHRAWRPGVLFALSPLEISHTHTHRSTHKQTHTHTHT